MEPYSGRAREILDTAIQLFNSAGVAASSTNKIAEAAGISSGNLHYHFRGKADLLAGVYRLIQADMYEVLSLDGAEMSPAGALAAQKRLFSTMWKYRFFFGEMDAFLGRSPVLFEEYVAFQTWLTGRIADLLRDISRQGHMHVPPGFSDPELFAANSWMLWTGWIHWEMVTQKHQRLAAPAEQVVLQIIRRHFNFQLPYYAPDFAAELKALIDAECAACDAA